MLLVCVWNTSLILSEKQIDQIKKKKIPSDPIPLVSVDQVGMLFEMRFSLLEESALFVLQQKTPDC